MIKLKEGMAIHCKDKEEAYLFLKECERQGVTTCAKNPATKLYDLDVWEQNKEKTCFGITMSLEDYDVNGSVGFSNRNTYRDCGFDIIEFDDFIKEDNEIEEEIYLTSNKIIKLVVKLTDGNTLVLEGNEVIDMPEIIEQRFQNKDEFIIFGYMGIRRDLIEWYKINEVT